jgi:hypothetical protein
MMLSVQQKRPHVQTDFIMKTPSFIISLFFLLTCNAQENQKEILEIENYSSYNDTKLDGNQETERTLTSYDSIIQDVMNRVGLPNSDIEIRTTPTFGAFSVINRNCKRRFFLYNKIFFDSIYTVTKSVQPIKSVCFHEIAHHLYRHPLKSKWEAQIHELEADRYSGFQMRLIGASLEESIAAMEHFGNDTNTNTHPEKSIRINEIKAGYIDASKRIFNDSSYFQIDSLIQVKELLFAFQEVEKGNSDFKELNKESFKSDSTINFQNVFKQPTYNLLGKILIINEKNEVIDLASKEKVGQVTSPYPNAGFQLLKFETSTYKIENEEIYSISQFGTPIKLGIKIN